jgi:hypothetical protein
MQEKISAEQALREVPHRIPDEAQLTLVTGMRGTGKTWWLQHWVEDNDPRILILDYHEDFPHVRKREWRQAIADLAATDGPCRRRVVPPIGEASNCRDFAEEFFPAIVRDGGPRNFRLVIDELSLYCPTENLRAQHNKALETLILQGRRYGIGLVVACQRLNRIPGEMHSEATEILVFRTKRPRDLKVLEDWGLEGDPTSLARGELYIIVS